MTIKGKTGYFEINELGAVTHKDFATGKETLLTTRDIKGIEDLPNHEDFVNEMEELLSNFS